MTQRISIGAAISGLAFDFERFVQAFPGAGESAFGVRHDRQISQGHAEPAAISGLTGQIERRPIALLSLFRMPAVVDHIAEVGLNAPNYITIAAVPEPIRRPSPSLPMLCPP